MPSTQSDLPELSAPATQLAGNEVPDWDRIEGELHCPRCAYNLRTLTGSRCPECGLDLDWPAIITADARKEHIPLFEYQWRKRPIQALLRSLVMSVTPWRSWKIIPLTATPRIGPLIIQPILAVFVAIPLVVLSGIVTKVLVGLIFQSRVSFAPLRFFLPSDAAFKISLQQQGLLGMTIFLFQCLFHQTISRRRIRRSHLLRISVFVVLALTVKEIAQPCIWGASYTGYRYLPLLPHLDFALDAMFEIAFMLLMTWVLSRAFRDYLCIPRAWAVAVAVIALTALMWITITIGTCVLFDAWDTWLVDLWIHCWPGVSRLVDLIFGF